MARPSDQLQEIAALIGWPATIQLCLELGGLREYIPKHPKPGSRLSQIVGHENAQILAQHYGGDRPEIPVSRRLLIEALRRQGHSMRAIAKLLRVSERTVRRVSAPEANLMAQLALFPDS